MSFVRRFWIAITVFLVFLALILIGVFFYFSIPEDSTSAPVREATPPTPSLGLDNIDGITQIDPLEFGVSFEDEVVVGEGRDDRVYTPPLSEGRDEGGGSAEDTKTIPRLMRLFKGPTAGYRIDANEDGVREVKVVSQGRGHRYTINIIPYSLRLVSRGEFTRVVEAHIFSDDQVLVQYESVENESLVRSSFVPFFTSESGSQIQWFEDNIRVATNNETLLFFTQTVDDESVGVVVDVSDPKKTRVVWESGFTSWIPRWGRSSRILLRTPATEHMKGLIYLVDPEGVLPVNQFVTLSSGGSAFIDTSTDYFVLFEKTTDDFVGKTSVTNRNRDISIDLPDGTLPEKCDGFNGIFVCAVPTEVLSQTITGYDTIYPDSWYQGDLQFSDAVVLVNALTGEKDLLMHPDDREIRLLSDDSIFDIIHPTVSEDGEFLFFVNKYDMSLWMLRLF